MKDIFPKLIFPFVYLDSSFAYRKKSDSVQKLTRNLMIKNPQRFYALLNELMIASQVDYPYYKRIIQLQRENVISTVVTYEVFQPSFVVDSPSLISLFGSINNIPFINSSSIPHFSEDLVLWGENVKTKSYVAAAMAILNSPCVVADDAFLSLAVGRGLMQYVTSDCLFYILKCRNQPQNYEKNFVSSQLSPEEFIRILHAYL